MIAKLRKNQEPNFRQVESLSNSLSNTLLWLTTDLQNNNAKGIEEAKLILLMLDQYELGPKIISESFLKLEQMKIGEEQLVKKDEIINIFKHIDLPRYSQYILMRSQVGLSGIEKNFLELLTSRPTEFIFSETENPNNSLDVTAPSPLKVDEQQPIERKTMGDNQKNTTELASLFVNASDPVALGEAIRSVRLNAGLSQTQLIAVTDISLSTLSRIETGKTKPTLSTLSNIAKATNTELKIGFTSPKQG